MDWFPVFLSLRVALLAGSLALIIGIPLGYFMTRTSLPGKEILEAFILLPLVLPPSVLGFVLLMIFGSNSSIGSFLQDMGINVIFTWGAAVIASTCVALPLAYQSIKASFQLVDQNLEQAASTLGASKLKVFFTISIPLALPGLLSGFVLAFARAMGEFGATMMIAGNIPGRTQTMPLAIYFAVEADNYGLAAKLVAIITVFSFAVILWSNWWGKKHKY